MTGWLASSAIPSIVTISRPVMAPAPSVQERIGRPSTWTVQLPQWPAPHPNFVPVNPSVSRNTQSNGVSVSASTSTLLPLIRSVNIAVASMAVGLAHVPARGRPGAAGKSQQRTSRNSAPDAERASIGAASAPDQLADQAKGAIALCGIVRVRDDGDLIDKTGVSKALQLIARLVRSSRNREPFDQFVRDEIAMRGTGNHVLIVLVMLPYLVHDVHRCGIELEGKLPFQDPRDVGFDRVACGL